MVTINSLMTDNLTIGLIPQVILLFNSLKALKTIIHALTSAIIPVSNAFAVLAVATAIYAVIGVGLYDEVDPEKFGDFKKAIFTVRWHCEIKYKTLCSWYKLY